MLNHYKDTLLLAEQIINTCDTTRPEPEYLRTPTDLERYVRRWNIPLVQEPDAQDLAEVLALRRRLRSVFETRDMAVVAGILNELLVVDAIGRIAAVQNIFAA